MDVMLMAILLLDMVVGIGVIMLWGVALLVLLPAVLLLCMVLTDMVLPATYFGTHNLNKVYLG